ncbi:hypothetical protein CMEL01_16823 [Colletotrichum melonis]|uniref:Uncharacterized protein n=1 Tax=Colletotrichum melonis TaxID=1209925 RepID=A0AAI9XE08_9PEZI|nr:hypothetical protein CMEL01_16823 [Colletotrichum melonis]
MSSKTPSTPSSNSKRPIDLASELARVEDDEMPDVAYDSDGDAVLKKADYEKMRRTVEKSSKRNKELAELFNSNSAQMAATLAKNNEDIAALQNMQLSWTACYDDNCLTHQDSKEQTGWYPKQPKNTGRSGYDTTPSVRTLAVATKEEKIPAYRPCTLKENNIECIATLSQICKNIEEKAKTDPVMKDTLHLLKGRIKQRLLASTREQLLKFEERGPDTEEIMSGLVYMARRNHMNQKQPIESKEGLDSDNIPTKSICMMRRVDADKKFIRKVKEQLKDLAREDKIEVLKRPTLDFGVTKEGKINFNPKEEEDIEIGTSSFHFNEAESPYDSDEPRDVARRRAQMEIDHKAPPSVDDTSSEEDDDEPRCKHIHPFEDDQIVQFYGTGERKKVAMTPHTDKDHSLLDPEDPFHKELFWAECLDDKCLQHLAYKQDSRFYPRRRDNKPIKDIYVEDQLPSWTLLSFDDSDKATFGPDPSFPMKCLNSEYMEWEDCRHDQCQIHYIGKAKAWREHQERHEQRNRPKKQMTKN